MVSSNAAFSAIVPFLLLAATLIFVFAAPLRTWASQNARAVTLYGAIGLIMVSVCGGYFNGGFGIVLLALFSMWGMSNIHQVNGLKNWLSFALSAISVLAFAIGGYSGAPIAKALPPSAVSLIVIAVGFGMSAIYFARQFL